MLDFLIFAAVVVVCLIVAIIYLYPVRIIGVTIHRTGQHRTAPDHTGPHRVRTGPEMTDYFTYTTN